MHPVTPAGVLAGRDDELALLSGLLRDLAQGSGNAVLIEGEPGIGKTALIRAAVSAAAYEFPAQTGARRGSPRQLPGLLGIRGRARPGAPAPSVPRSPPSSGTLGKRQADDDRRAAPRRGRHRPRRRRARAAGRAAHRAHHRRDQRATGRPGDRRSALGRPGLREALGPARQDRPSGAAAAHRRDPSGPAARGPVRAAPRGRRCASGPARLARAARGGGTRRHAGRRPTGYGAAPPRGQRGGQSALPDRDAGRAGKVGWHHGHADGRRPARGRRRARLAARRHRRPARVRLRADEGGAPRGGAARRGVRDHRSDRGARPDRGRPGPRARRGPDIGGAG